MQNRIGRFALVVASLWSTFSYAQGPPITGDKPIMLGANRWVVRTLIELRRTESGSFVNAPLMVHYLPSSSTLLGVHVPLVTYPYGEESGRQRSLGDVIVFAKYQFYRRDRTGKTFRVVAKTRHSLPTGPSLGLEGISTGNYQGYAGLVAGYETIKYGIGGELGYNVSPYDNLDELRYKLGFGLPLLKPTYPVNQVNLYFEYQGGWFPETDRHMLLYAQGLQYARGRFTWEASVQLPLVQTMPEAQRRRYSLFLGTRFVF